MTLMNPSILTIEDETIANYVANLNINITLTQMCNFSVHDNIPKLVTQTNLLLYPIVLTG